MVRLKAGMVHRALGLQKCKFLSKQSGENMVARWLLCKKSYTCSQNIQFFCYFCHGMRISGNCLDFTIIL